MTPSNTWYIVKRPEGNCEIIPAVELQNLAMDDENKNTSTTERWGPFDSEAEATARRIGLIRAGKCQPV
jgi:hypothetical protein